MFSVNEFWPGEFFICDEGNAIAVGRDYIMAGLISTRLNDHARRLKDAQELCIILGAKDADALLDTAKRVIEERDSLKREIQIRRDYAEERELRQ